MTTSKIECNLFNLKFKFFFVELSTFYAVIFTLFQFCSCLPLKRSKTDHCERMEAADLKRAEKSDEMKSIKIS